MNVLLEFNDCHAKWQGCIASLQLYALTDYCLRYIYVIVAISNCYARISDLFTASRSNLLTICKEVFLFCIFFLLNITSQRPKEDSHARNGRGRMRKPTRAAPPSNFHDEKTGSVLGKLHPTRAAPSWQDQNSKTRLSPNVIKNGVKHFTQVLARYLSMFI